MDSRTAGRVGGHRVVPRAVLTLAVATVIGLVAGAVCGVAASAASAPPSGACALAFLPGYGEGTTPADQYPPANGTVPALMLFVDFSDAPASPSEDPTTMYDDNVPAASSFFTTASYGQLNLSVTPVQRWLRMPRTAASYGGYFSLQFIEDALAAATPYVGSFAPYKILYIVPAGAANGIVGYDASASAPFEAPNPIVAPDGTTITQYTELNSDELNGNVTEYNGLPIGADSIIHETEHDFAIPDLFQSGLATGIDSTTRGFDLEGGSPWALDLFAWNKWKLDWLSPSQVDCIASPGTSTVAVSPVETSGATEMVAVRTGPTTTEVAEVRAATGEDSAACSTGVVIYTVDSSMSSGGNGATGMTGLSPIMVHPSPPGNGTCASDTLDFGNSALDDSAWPPNSTFADPDSGVTFAIGARNADGSFDITVTAPSTNGQPPTFAADSPALSPAQGPAAGGTPVTISGNGFSGATQVYFGATPAASFTVVSATEIDAVSPNIPIGLGAGVSNVVAVRVVSPAGATPVEPTAWDLYDLAPQVKAVSPASGPPQGGTTVTITGAGLTDVTGVDFGTTPAASYAVNYAAQTITATAPAGTGAQDVQVLTTYGDSPVVAADRFNYEGPPTVTALTPASGGTPGRTSVTISGTNLAGASAVTFGGTAATITSDTATAITARAPAGAVGPVDVQVVTGSGTSATSSADQFTYTATPLTPAVTSLSPASGPKGSLVLIFGRNLQQLKSVTFGGVKATISLNIATTIAVALAPAGTANTTVDVQVTTSNGRSSPTSGDHFHYT